MLLLRAELRDRLVKREPLVLTEWLAWQPVSITIVNNEAGQATLLYEPAGPLGRWPFSCVRFHPNSMAWPLLS